MSRELSNRANFWLHALEGSLCMAGMGIFGARSVLPLLAQKLGGSSIVIGSLGTIVSMPMVFQIVAARYIEPMRNKKRHVMITGFFMRWPYVIVPIALLLMGRNSPTTVLWIMLATLAVGSISGALLVPGWLEMLRQTIPENRRGRLFGARQFLASLMILGAGFVVKWLLDTLPFPYDYAAVGVISGVAVSLSWVLFGLVNAPPVPSSREVVPWGRFFKELWHVLCDQPALRLYLLWCVLTSAMLATTVFLPTALTTAIGVSVATVGIYMVVASVARAAAAPLWGVLVDHLGPRRMLPVGAGILVAAMLTAAYARGAATGAVAYGLMSVGASLVMVCRPAAIMELAHGEHKVAQLVLPSLLSWPVMTVAPLGAGVLVGVAGYPKLFVVAAGVGVLALLVSMSVAVALRHER